MNRCSYDAIAQAWDSARTCLSEAEERLFGYLAEGTSAGARVLDLGCGTGRPVAEYFASHGAVVTGVDQSERMLTIARQRLPDHTWILSSLEEFKPDGTFAAALAWDSMFHIPREQHEAIWHRVRSSLAAGARFALTIGGKEHPAFTDTMFEKTFFYDSHAPEKALSILEDSGFNIVHHEFLNPPTSGRDKGRVAIIASAA